MPQGFVKSVIPGSRLISFTSITNETDAVRFHPATAKILNTVACICFVISLLQCVQCKSTVIKYCSVSKVCQNDKNGNLQVIACLTP
jgi:hypothetical protein